MSLQCVLFDLDGVLVDACEWHYLALNLALKQLVDTEITRYDHEKTYNGLPTKIKLQKLGITGAMAKKVWELKQQFTISTIEEHSSVLQEKVELHSFLKDNNVKIGCVTNSIKDTAIMMLEKTGQLNFIDLLITNEDVANNKPHPDCYNLALDILKVDPKNTIIVEDSPVGYAAAKKSKVPNIWKVNNAKDTNLVNYRRYVSENFNSNGRRR